MKRTKPREKKRWRLKSHVEITQASMYRRAYRWSLSLSASRSFKWMIMMRSRYAYLTLNSTHFKTHTQSALSAVINRRDSFRRKSKINKQNLDIHSDLSHCFCQLIVPFSIYSLVMQKCWENPVLNCSFKFNSIL